MTQQRWFERPGVRLALQDAGGGGVPFVFQHGLGGSAAQTAEVMPDVPGIRPMTLECRGHGASDAGEPQDFAIETFTDDLVALIETGSLAPVVAGGISMGAAIAARIAVTRPAAVRALVLARPAWVSAACPPNIAPYGEVGALLAEFPPEVARKKFLASPTAERLRRLAPDNLASLTGFFDRRPHDVTAALLTRIAADGPGISMADLRQIACPVLVIGHGDDLAHPFAACEELAALIPGARLVPIRSKVQSRQDYVADFKAALSAFLKDVIHDATRPRLV